MNIKKSILMAGIITLPFSNISSLEEKTRGMIIIEPEEMYFPSFPKVTFYNETDTINIQGDAWGIIRYNLPKKSYKIKVEPGMSPTKETGEDFEKYFSSINLKKEKNSFLILRPHNYNTK